MPGAEDSKPNHRTLFRAYVAAAQLEHSVGITLLPEREEGREEERSYEALFRASTRIANGLAALGVEKGDRVLILLPTCFDFVTVFFAIQSLGAIPVPTYPPMPFRAEIGLERLGHVARHSGARWCVTNDQLRVVLDELTSQTDVRHVVDVEALGRGSDREVSLQDGSDDPALIQYTSGSTGSPKGVLLTHQSLVANVHVIGRAVQIRSGDRVVSWLPLYHDMGLIGTVLFSIYWQVPLIMMSPLAFLSRPSRWLRAIHRHRGTLSAAPNFAYQVCTKRRRTADYGDLDLSSWRLALNGSETVSHRTMDEFALAFARHGFQKTAFLPVYGLAESSLAVTFPIPGRLPHHERIDRRALLEERRAVKVGSGEENSLAVVSVGHAMPGHHVRVVDDGGHSCAERCIGNVIVSGPSLMRGYYGDVEATHGVLREGWLWTGDLGYLAQGQLFITGRAKDMIVCRGHNYYAEDLERVAEGVDGVRLGGAVAVGVYDEAKAKESAVLICETTRTDEERKPLAEAIGAALLASCGLRIDEVVLVDPGQLPKTSSGKKQRSLCRQLYQQDSFNSSPLATGHTVA